MTRTRGWLRSFLRLDALQHVEHLSNAAVRLQEDTVLAALARLDQEPGVLLADEVGMGKTYQALGVIAATFERARAEGRAPRVLVVTPGPALNHQWLRSADTFAQKGFYQGFPAGTFCEISHITHLPGATHTHGVVFAPVNVFTSVRGQAERGALLELWFRRRGLERGDRTKVLKGIARSGVPIAENDTFLGCPLADFDRLPAAAFKRTRGGHGGLDDLYDAAGADGFSNARSIKKALDRVRFHALRSVLPTFDLLVIDEAHKLKNPWTVQAQAVAQVLHRTFTRAIFLTATPFQLGVEELKRVFQMFAHAHEVLPSFQDDVDALFAAIGDYQRTYDAFEQAWRYADHSHTRAFAGWYARVERQPVLPVRDAPVPGLEGVEDPNVLALARYAWELRRLKAHGVEPGFRRWTVRSLKPGKRQRRREEARRIVPGERAIAPLLLYQRLATERARSGQRTHVEAAETGIASSFSAALEGAMATDAGRTTEVDAYSALIRDVLGAARDEHPKVASVLDEAMSAASRWEKVLLFCERNATIEAVEQTIRRRWMGGLLARWQQLYPGNDWEGVFGAGSGDDRTVGIFQRWAGRFTKGGDQLSVALRESYPHTLFVTEDETGLPDAVYRDLPWLAEAANEVLQAQRTSGGSATRLDYRLARRCVDVAVARWFKRHEPGRLNLFGGVPRRLLDPSYPRLGIDLVEDEEEKQLVGDGDTTPSWSISEDVLCTLLDPSRPSLWFPFRAQLARIEDLTERGNVVEAVRTFLTRRSVPFILEVVERAGADASSQALRDTLERWWVTPECLWRLRVGELLDYLPRLGKSERDEVLGEALKRVDFAARGNDSNTRQRVQDAFNTPFFPMILVGNKTMQEGLNLHRQCRRVVHHDLRWNPADHEQRVGRVDRHGSLAERWLATSGQTEGHILVDTPLLERTIDPPRYRRVKEREKWLEFLLGAPPSVGHGELDQRELPPLPAALTEDLRVRLGPERAAE